MLKGIGPHPPVTRLHCLVFNKAQFYKFTPSLLQYFYVISAGTTFTYCAGVVNSVLQLATNWTVRGSNREGKRPLL
jgi:hypothetical protein